MLVFLSHFDITAVWKRSKGGFRDSNDGRLTKTLRSEYRARARPNDDCLAGFRSDSGPIHPVSRFPEPDTTHRQFPQTFWPVILSIDYQSTKCLVFQAVSHFGSEQESADLGVVVIKDVMKSDSSVGRR